VCRRSRPGAGHPPAESCSTKSTDGQRGLTAFQINPRPCSALKATPGCAGPGPGERDQCAHAAQRAASDFGRPFFSARDLTLGAQSALCVWPCNRPSPRGICPESTVVCPRPAPISVRPASGCYRRALSFQARNPAQPRRQLDPPMSNFVKCRPKPAMKFCACRARRPLATFAGGAAQGLIAVGPLSLRGIP